MNHSIDKKSTFNELLEKDNSFSIHKRNLCLPVTEVFKYKRNMTLVLIRKLTYKWQNSYELQNNPDFTLVKISEIRPQRLRKFWLIVDGFLWQKRAE